MPNKPKVQRPRIYLDANVFLTLFNRGEDSHTPEIGKTRLKTVVTLFQEAESGKIELFTSELTLAECPKSRHQPEEWTSQKIADFFENQWLQVIEVDREVVLQSREIQASFTIKPLDALHLATAQLMGDIDAVFSYDAKHIIKHGSVLLPDIKVCEPQLYWTTLPLNLED